MKETIGQSFSDNDRSAKVGFFSQYCLRSNVPLSILSTGTADDVRNYCKGLIDNVGRGGGFIMDASTQFDDARPENVKAMFEFTKEYGKY